MSQELLNKAIINYRNIGDQLGELSDAKSNLKDEILKYMRHQAIKSIDVWDEAGQKMLRARHDVRDGNTTISVEEARNLLDVDTFNKLAKTGESYETLSVRKVKAEK